jgi:hypothetical protein
MRYQTAPLPEEGAYSLAIPPRARTKDTIN